VYGDTLTRLLRKEGITSQDTWGNRLVIGKAACEPQLLLSSGELERMLDVSLLRWPYVSLLRDGAVPDVAKYTKSRNVIGHERPGFIDGDAVRAYLRAGASLKLNRMSDWHRPSRDIRRALEELLPVAVSCYAFWTPPEGRGMLPHRDGSHVIAIQLEGLKEWRIYGGSDRAEAGLEEVSSAPSHEFILEPGDLLYLPHGWTHEARAVGEERSLHLTFTLAEPSPEAMLEGLQATFAAEHPLHRRFHHLGLTDRAGAAQAGLIELAQTLSDTEWVQNALAAMRKEAG
jgi:hypothetical protein